MATRSHVKCLGLTYCLRHRRRKQYNLHFIRLDQTHQGFSKLQIQLKAAVGGKNIITLYLKLQNPNLMVTFYFVQMVSSFILSKPVKPVEIVSG